MKVNFDPKQLVDRQTLQGLMTRSNGPALIRLIGHMALFLGSFAALAYVGDQPWHLRAPLILWVGFLLFSLYAPFHEATHGTAFVSKRANLAVAWMTGVFYGYSPGVHADFHFEHHRKTNAADDPEKGLSLPADVPLRTPLLWLLIGLFGTLPALHSMILAVAPVRAWDRLEAAWTRPRHRAQLKRESAIVGLLWLGAIIAGAVFAPGLLLDCAVALLIARLIHAAITISEHEGMPVEGHQIERTRTVTSNPLLRFFWWNMNYHAEHHAWPAVPFHQLPALHRLVVGQGVPTERGYLHFYLRRGYREVERAEPRLADARE